MDTISIPVLTREDRLTDCVSAMRDAKRSAILVENADDYSVVYIGKVLEALDGGAKTISDIYSTAAQRAYLARESDAAHFEVDLIRPMRTWRQYETLLDAENAAYSVVGRASDFAMIVTRHERLRDQMAHANTYYCVGGRKTHYFPEPIATVGSECESCVGYPKGIIHLK